MSMKHGLGFRKDNANENKGHLSLLEMDFVECSLSSVKIMQTRAKDI